jgi:hypothetical protein
VGAQLAGLEIDYSVRRVEEPRVRVPLIDGGGVLPVAARQPLDGGDGAKSVFVPRIVPYTT